MYCTVSSQRVQEESILINGLQYTTVICSDEGLRCLSQRLLNKSVSAVGCCLGLDESFVQHVKEDRAGDQHKMHELLMEWRHGEEPATWSNLAQRFTSLEDNSLMEEIRQVACGELNSEEQSTASDSYR